LPGFANINLRGLEMKKETFHDVDSYYQDLFIEEDPRFDQINQSAQKAGLPTIQVTPLQGKFLQLLVNLQRSKRVLEIGTLGGYSTAWLASGLPDDGILISLEIDPHHAQVAEENLARFQFNPKIQILVGDGQQLIDEMVQSGTKPFDMIFIDADKEGYADYLNRVINLSRPGTFIIADNVVRRGNVIKKKSQDSSVKGIRRFNKVVAQNPRLQATTLQTVGAKGYDGFTFIMVN
jgi:predicted O-methyltransferase YrrM